jgi:hypothetical protein
VGTHAGSGQCSTGSCGLPPPAAPRSDSARRQADPKAHVLLGLRLIHDLNRSTTCTSPATRPAATARLQGGGCCTCMTGAFRTRKTWLHLELLCHAQPRMLGQCSTISDQIRHSSRWLQCFCWLLLQAGSLVLPSSLHGLWHSALCMTQPQMHLELLVLQLCNPERWAACACTHYHTHTCEL